MLRRAALSLRCVTRGPRSLRVLSALPALRQHRAMPTVPRFMAPFSTEPPLPSLMTEHQFMELADDTLHEIQEWLDGIEEMLDESDIMYSQGVLKIDLGEHGTWVINRQVPNRQIWWSSPISGPRRYEYDAELEQWVNTRDRGELMELLHKEILEATGIEIYH